MAYKVSYKVVSEQGDQLKNIAKDMDNYVSQMNGIISKLGNDELLQSIRSDLNKFVKQLEEEKTVLNLAGQVITEVVQSYTCAEKKSVQKVDRAKAHNRDFYKRPVSVPSAGGSGGVAAGAAGAATNVNVNAASASFTSFQNTTNIFGSSGAGISTAGASFTSGIASAAGRAASPGGSGISGAAAAGIAAAAGMAAAGGAAAGAMAAEKKKEDDPATE